MTIMMGDLEEMPRNSIYNVSPAIQKLIDATHAEIRNFVKSEFIRISNAVRELENGIVDDEEEYRYVKESKSSHVWKRLIHTYGKRSVLLSRNGYVVIDTNNLNYFINAPSSIFDMMMSKDKESRVLAGGMLDAIHDRNSTGN